MSAPEVRTPADVAELRRWLADQWKPGNAYHRVAAPALTGWARRQHASGLPPGQLSDGYARWEREAMQAASLWWVAEPMVDLLLAAADSVPPDVQLAELPQPSPSGLVVFAKPWAGQGAEQQDDGVQVDAMLWGDGRMPTKDLATTRRCVAVSSYRRLAFHHGLAPHELHLAAATGAIDLVHLERIDGTPVERAELRTGNDTPVRTTWDATGDAWAPMGRSDWPRGDALATEPWDSLAPERLGSMVEDRRVLAALWQLIHQEGIAQRTEAHIPRATARRAERDGTPRAEARRPVQVVTLRKPRTEPNPDAEPGTRKVHHDHRWLVGGHWRWQPYGPGRTLRRLQWIAPYVKGPGDMPLRVPEKVNAWVR